MPYLRRKYNPKNWIRRRDPVTNYDQTSQADADQMVAEARVEFLTAPIESYRWPEKLLLQSVHKGFDSFDFGYRVLFTTAAAMLRRSPRR